MSMIKRTRTTPRGYTLPKYACFDCNEPTGSPMQVYRMMGSIDEPYLGTAMVHRNGTGCHKALTASEVRDPNLHR